MRPYRSTFTPNQLLAQTCGRIQRDLVAHNPKIKAEQKNELYNRFGAFMHSFNKTLDLSRIGVLTLPASLKHLGCINLLQVSPEFEFEPSALEALRNVRAITNVIR